MDEVVYKTVLVEITPPASVGAFGDGLITVELKFDFRQDEWVIQDNRLLNGQRRYLDIISRDVNINCMASNVC